MKKKYHLKSNVKIALLTIILLIGAIAALIAIDSSNYKKAVKRCGNSNIITKYTQQGDKYYLCNN